MSPVFTQEFVPDTQSQSSTFATWQNTQGSAEAGRIVRASFTALSLALSLGATGSLISSAEAADSMQLAALPSVTGAPGTLPSFGSSRPDGASATYHTVTDGETIWDIAKRHGVTVEDIKAANGIGEGQVIQAGQVLKVPTVAPVAAALQPTAVLTVPDKVAAASPTINPAELQPELVDEGQREELQAAPLNLSEFLSEQQEDTQEASDADKVASGPSAMSDTSMSTAAANEPDAIALLPESEPFRNFAEEFDTAAKPSTKQVEAETAQEELPQIFSGSSAAYGRTQTHRVGSGESAWSIARSYGVDVEDLQAANNINDPSFIVAGDELVIPEGANTQPEVEPDIERLSRRQTASEQRMASLAPVLAKDAPTSEEVSSTLAIDLEQSALEVAPEIAIADPFVEGLLSDVAMATQTQVDVAAATADRYASAAIEDAESETEVTSQSADAKTSIDDSEEVAVNPQFSGEVDADSVEDSRSILDSEELLAAAPLGSEVYAPVIENPEGRVVSPEMPVLPGQDQFLPEAPNRFEGYIWPAQGVLTSGYGWRWGRMHRGVDIAGPVGTPIYAAGPGVVVKSGWNSGGYGNLVDIRHPDGSMTRYAHNSRLLVSEGQQVRQGQQIAEMGSTGYSTGPHLHFEIHVPNQGTVNPIALLPGR